MRRVDAARLSTALATSLVAGMAVAAAGNAGTAADQAGDPATPHAVREVADRFKGTYDLAGAAEALVQAAGPEFVYSLRDRADPGRDASSARTFDELWRRRRLTCDEFVQYVAHLAGSQIAGGGGPLIRGSTPASDSWTPRAVWDGSSEIPRGSVVVFVAYAFDNAGGFYHVGISLGDGRIAHISSRGNVQISQMSALAGLPGIREVRVADYSWRQPGDAPRTARPAPSGPTPVPLAQMPPLLRALDEAPPGLRFAGSTTCCGDPLGELYPARDGRTAGGTSLYVTGATIDVWIDGTAPAQPAGVAGILPNRLPYAHTWRPGATELPVVQLVATGAPSGDAFRLEVAGAAGVTGRVFAVDGLVLEALAAGASAAAGRPAVSQPLSAFSAQYARNPPRAGTLYRVAEAKLQERLKPLRHLVRAASHLAREGRLRFDSDPAAYLNFVAQWSMWTSIERWDLRRFGDQFVARSKRELAERQQPWSRQIEQQVRALVPGRWGDVQAVIRAAEAIAAATP